MLVLTRSEGQSIDIGTGIKITITRVCGGRVRVGIQAPADVRVMRTEKVTRDADQAIERSKALARRKELYEALHPETTKGTAGAVASNAKQGKGNATDNVSVASFAADTAAKTGQSERQVRRDDHQEVDG